MEFRCGLDHAESLKLVNTASDALFKLRESFYTFEDEPYQDGCSTELVNTLKNS